MNRILLVGRNRNFPTFTPPRDAQPPRGNLTRFTPSLVERVSSLSVEYDATDDRWIRPPSGKKPDAVAAAEQLRPERTRRYPSHFEPRPAASLSPKRAAGYLREVLEFFVVLTGIGASVICAVLLWAVMS